MWAIWPELPAYGRKAAQFVDLLGYFSLKTPQTEKKVVILKYRYRFFKMTVEFDYTFWTFQQLYNLY